MKLNYKKLGEGPALIIVHGLYGSLDNWLSVAKELSQNFEVFLIDQRNHGNSPHADSHTYSDLKNDLLEFMDDQQIDKAVLLGHSMGGKTVMFFAIDHPERVSSLLVVDIAPKNYSKISDYAPQTINHEHLVSVILNMDLTPFNSRTEINLELAKQIKSEKVRQFLLKNLKRNEDKRFGWKLNIKTISDYLPQIMDGIDESSFLKGKGITGFPVLFIKGEESNYICDNDHKPIRSIFPYAEITSIPKAGHWVHAEQPDLLVKTINYFVLE
ncbi:alpha/beta fold hydrolase [Ancylomarina euxinus]|uniref:Alpha/beta fold hydrolase n=1 Tax=Ancylomarina euxinus TaxID=2283627 RepID=A0A425XY11_9BACT|nr:alpha/beta fold hydrolase [Ancylomarina euxinus]MCZ4695905.1 alpha/beta fold hydrolase [Ancylomarina euxinus]MUP16281.1 alpha/beta fold hydrolase [Ancylomarina euxinus]RRG19653.1 alpha/beta fold hydrolase [Ancylomarina euxinus]